MNSYHNSKGSIGNNSNFLQLILGFNINYLIRLSILYAIYIYMHIPTIYVLYIYTNSTGVRLFEKLEQVFYYKALKKTCKRDKKNKKIKKVCARGL